MKTYTDTDVEVNHLVSCEVCGNWYWSKRWSMFICDDCRSTREQQIRDYKNTRNRKQTKRPTQDSMRKAAAIYKIVCEHVETGINQYNIKEIMNRRGWNIKSQSADLLGLLDYTGHLIWMDDDGRLYPYMNTNTGERYD